MAYNPANLSYVVDMPTAGYAVGQRSLWASRIYLIYALQSGPSLSMDGLVTW